MAGCGEGKLKELSLLLRTSAGNLSSERRFPCPCGSSISKPCCGGLDPPDGLARVVSSLACESRVPSMLVGYNHSQHVRYTNSQNAGGVAKEMHSELGDIPLLLNEMAPRHAYPYVPLDGCPRRLL